MAQDEKKYYNHILNVFYSKNEEEIVKKISHLAKSGRLVIMFNDKIWHEVENQSRKD